MKNISSSSSLKSIIMDFNSFNNEFYKQPDEKLGKISYKKLILRRMEKFTKLETRFTIIYNLFEIYLTMLGVSVKLDFWTKKIILLQMKVFTNSETRFTIIYYMFEEFFIKLGGQLHLR